MAVTTSPEMTAALLGGMSHFCPVCRSDKLVLERLAPTSALNAEQEAGCMDCMSTWTISYAFSAILNLDSDDRRMGPEQLREKYDGDPNGGWGQHPEHLTTDWVHEVSAGDTRLGYWEWVQHRLQEVRADG